jgi:uncharacterized cupin superfamily protein
VTVNVADVVLDEPLDEAGFRHRAASIGERLGARRIGATVYEAEAGAWIWPYHYHHGIEEWLYVLSGAPVLREPAGSRALAPGDLVCFPEGAEGAHTLSGPGRFVLFAAEHGVGPYMTVYPDSDKVSGHGGIWPRATAVGYWHGEGTAGAVAPERIVREPRASSPRPVTNLLGRPLGTVHGGERLAAALLDGTSDAYTYVHGREQWLLVVAGTPALRRPDGERRLAPGDLICFPDGPDGAHRLLGGGDSRALLLSTTGLPAAVHHPDTGRWVLDVGQPESVALIAE